MAHDFARTVLGSLEALFDDGEIETLVQASGSNAVKVVHSSVVEVIEDRFDSQVRNKAVALAGLLVQLKRKH